MEVLREEVYQSTPSLWPSAEDTASPNEEVQDDSLLKGADSVVVQLQDIGPYNDLLIVKLEKNDEIIDEFEFEVLSDEYRICRTEEQNPPLILLHYVADFGYYVEGSENGPWGQYEYLINAAGHLQSRSQESDNPIINLFFDHLTYRLEMLCVELASNSRTYGQDFDVEALARATEVENVEQAQTISGITELERLPLAEKTKISDRFKELGLSHELVRLTEQAIQGVKVSVYAESEQNVIGVIVSLPWGMKYFKFNGEFGGKCSIEFTNRRELPGIFVEDYFESEFNTEIQNTPRIISSDSNLDMLGDVSTLLTNIRETEDLRMEPDSEWLEDTELAIELAKIYLVFQSSVGEKRFLRLVDDICRERTDNLTIDELAQMPFDQFKSAVILLGLAVRQLGEDERTEAVEYIKRNDLDEFDTELNDIEEYIYDLTDPL